MQLSCSVRPETSMVWRMSASVSQWFPELFSYLNTRGALLAAPIPAPWMMINQRDMACPGSFIVLMTWSHKLFRPAKLFCIKMAYFKAHHTHVLADVKRSDLRQIDIAEILKPRMKCRVLSLQKCFCRPGQNGRCWKETVKYYMVLGI